MEGKADSRKTSSDFVVFYPGTSSEESIIVNNKCPAHLPLLSINAPNWSFLHYSYLLVLYHTMYKFFHLKQTL